MFFACGFGRRIWREVMKICHIENPPTMWEDILQWGIKEWKDKELKAVLCKLYMLGCNSSSFVETEKLT
jgi:hypothetical protein